MNSQVENSCSFKKYPGYTLRYKRMEGDRHLPAIVLVHGLASNHTRWTEFIENTTLAGQFNILRVDLMGHGLSLQHRRVTRRDWCNDIAEILAHEGFNDAIIIGHSMGAQVAIEFAYHYPALSRGVVLLDPTFPQLLHGVLGGIRKVKWLLWALMWLTIGLNRLGLKRQDFPLRDLYELDKQTRIKLADDHSIASLYMNPVDDLKFIPVSNYLQDIYELLRPLPQLEKVSTKVLAIVSTGAQISDRQATAHQLDRFPRNEIQPIDADHWPLTENFEQTCKLIDQWCLQFNDEGNY